MLLLHDADRKLWLSKTVSLHEAADKTFETNPNTGKLEKTAGVVMRKARTSDGLVFSESKGLAGGAEERAATIAAVQASSRGGRDQTLAGLGLGARAVAGTEAATTQPDAGSSGKARGSKRKAGSSDGPDVDALSESKYKKLKGDWTAGEQSTKKEVLKGLRHMIEWQANGIDTSDFSLTISRIALAARALNATDEADIGWPALCAEAVKLYMKETTTAEMDPAEVKQKETQAAATVAKGSELQKALVFILTSGSGGTGFTRSDVGWMSVRVLSGRASSRISAPDLVRSETE